MVKIKSCKYNCVTPGSPTIAGSLLLCGISITNFGTTWQSAHVRYGVTNTDPIVYQVIVPAKDTVMATFKPPIEFANGIWYYKASATTMSITVFYIPLS